MELAREAELEAREARLKDEFHNVRRRDLARFVGFAYLHALEAGADSAGAEQAATAAYWERQGWHVARVLMGEE